MAKLKDVLLPFAAIFTVCPIMLVVMFYIMDNFGPASFMILLFIVGVLCLIGLIVIHFIEKKRAANPLVAVTQDHCPNCGKPL